MSSHLAAAEYIEEQLQRDGRIVISAIGRSMLPLIRPNSSIEIQRCAPSSLKPGDILLVKKKGGFVLHRLFEIRRRDTLLFVTKGDNSLHHDAPVEEPSVLGRVISVGNTPVNKQFWAAANWFLIFCLIRIPGWHARLARKNWYKALSVWEHRFFKKNSLVFPVVKKIISLPGRIASIGQSLCRASCSARVAICLPGIYFADLAFSNMTDRANALWQRTFPEFSFESSVSFRQFLFSRHVAVNPFGFAAVVGNRCLGLIFATEKHLDRDGRKACSLEVVAVDPDFRRRGIGVSLLHKLEIEGRKRNLPLVTTCADKIVFQGLHSERHSGLINLLIRKGFENPSFTSEMMVTPGMYKTPEIAGAPEKKMFLDSVTCKPLLPANVGSFIEFLKKENHSAFIRYANEGTEKFHGFSSHQMIFCAERRGEILGLCRVGSLAQRTTPAALARSLEFHALSGATARNSYVLHALTVARKWRHRGIGSLLVGFSLTQTFKCGGEFLFWDTQLPEFFVPFGARRRASFLALQAAIN